LIDDSGEAAAIQALNDVNRQFTRSDGSIRYDNVFVWVAGIPT
jgi:hypothetical protein